MCNSKVKPYPVAQIDGRPVLQPAGNRVVASSTATTRVLKKSASMPAARHSSAAPAVDTGVVSPRLLASSIKAAPKRGLKPINNNSPDSKCSSSLNSSTDGGSSKPPSPRSPGSAARYAAAAAGVKKPKKSTAAQQKPDVGTSAASLAQYITLTGNTLLFDDRVPGSLAAAQREQASLVQAQRKLRIAHYGRTKSAKFDNRASALAVVPAVVQAGLMDAAAEGIVEEKRCGFITSNSDPVYVAYHDEEWGVPIHDDNLLFELLVLSGAQVGLDWTTILKRRQDFRSAFAGFDPEKVSKFTEKHMVGISLEYGIDLPRIRGVVDNSKRILEAQKESGSFSSYVWGFVNYKPLSPSYRSSRKIPVKTSKSESISKDMVRRGFRFVGPTVVHYFMQAAGLTNDHVVSCPRHSECAVAAKQQQQ